MSEVEDGEILEVLGTGFSGSSTMHVVPEEEAGSSQQSASGRLTESPCNTNDGQILPSSQKEVSQSVLVSLEGWLANPPSSGPQFKARTKPSRKSSRHILPQVIPDVPGWSRPRHCPHHR